MAGTIFSCEILITGAGDIRVCASDGTSYRFSYQLRGGRSTRWDMYYYHL